MYYMSILYKKYNCNILNLKIQILIWYRRKCTLARYFKEQAHLWQHTKFCIGPSDVQYNFCLARHFVQRLGVIQISRNDGHIFDIHLILLIIPSHFFKLFFISSGHSPPDFPLQDTTSDIHSRYKILQGIYYCLER